LKSDKGKEVFRRLLSTAQIVVESFRPGVIEALGFGPDAVLAINPKIIMVRISGWGQTGPYRERPGFGALVEAASGFAAKNGFADKPPVLPNMALADMVAGLSGAFATMVALRAAEQAGGKGQVVDLSLLEPLHAILGPDAALHRLTGAVMPRSGNHASITAPRNIYATRDGGWVALAASTEGMVQKLFAAIGQPELYDDPRFRTNEARLAHADEIDEIVQAFIAGRTVAETVAFFADAGVTIGPVYDSESFPHDPHVAAREILLEMPDEEMGSVPMHNVVPRLSGTPGAIRTPAPKLGEHEAEILGMLED
jgi:crotonobetainyl-CoA:carnitine CoA-transferase CaiB-like acyl-CoA transferase